MVSQCCENTLWDNLVEQVNETDFIGNLHSWESWVNTNYDRRLGQLKTMSLHKRLGKTQEGWNHSTIRDHPKITSRFSLLRLLYFCHKILDTPSALKAWGLIWTTPYLSLVFRGLGALSLSNSLQLFFELRLPGSEK